MRFKIFLLNFSIQTEPFNKIFVLWNCIQQSNLKVVFQEIILTNLYQWKYARHNWFSSFLHTWQCLNYTFHLALHTYLLVWPYAVSKYVLKPSLLKWPNRNESLWRQTDTAHEYSGHEIKYKLWIDSYKTPFHHFKRINMKSQRVYNSSLCGMIPVILLVLCFFTANATDIVYGLF